MRPRRLATAEQLPQSAANPILAKRRGHEKRLDAAKHFSKEKSHIEGKTV